ncbi:MAG: protein-disulfide reductase DsbD [Burkholderiales bacterium]|nr:protein-disulfide reductase DsbD [Burkholderiales bacterium]
MHSRIGKLLITVFMLFVASISYAEDDFLPPEVAFKFSAKMADPQTVAVTFAIADGYYMYRERFAFKATGATLGNAVFPKGKIKFDDTFQKNVETYRKSVTMTMPVKASGTFTLIVNSQGCADKGLCYAPMESTIKLSPSGKGALIGTVTDAQINIDGNSSESILANGRSGLWGIIFTFIGIGLGLSLLPCHWPMYSILSFLIIGEGSHISRSRSLLLSIMYSLGMALVYTALGVAAGLLGKGLTGALQHPALLSVFALLMVLLALAMFDVYQLQMPASVQTKLLEISNKQKAGKLAGVFVMGVLSALIVGPCMTAPLSAALLYIGQTRDVVIGGSALFAMAMGISVPLLLIGASAGALLPRAGAWMEEVKHFFGVIMLGTALWIISPALPGWAKLAGWMSLVGGYGVHLLWTKRTHWAGKLAGILFSVIGLIQLTGLATGAQDPLAPLAKVTGTPSTKAEFARVKSLAELDAALMKSKGKTVMLDFYADWCVSCKEMESFTFTDTRVKSQFADMVLLQVDVTANTEDDKALLKRFKLFGPPGIVFFDRQGQEIQEVRVIGYQDAEKFSGSLLRATQS